MSEAQHFSVVIIGGGPAGAITASLLRRQDPDRSVLLLESDHHPRHHVGESSIASWGETLERAGLLEKVRDAGFMWKVGTLFHWGRDKDQSWTIDFRDYVRESELTSWQVDRARFDELCFRHAAELGADAREGHAVKSVQRRDEGFVVETADQRFTCDYLVDASGQARVLSRLWKLPVSGFPNLNNFAIYGYWRGSKIAEFGDPLKQDQRWTYIGTTRDGWLWHIPIEEDLVSVGLVTTKASIPGGGAELLAPFYEENLEANAKMADLLADAERVQHPLARSSLLTCRDWSYAADKTCGPRWFMVGDTASFVDPIFSTGLLFTAHGASLVANALHTIWNDEGVDTELLERSYDDCYKRLTGTYHAMAQVWYTRNLTVGSLHWESRRRVLGAGVAVADEAEAFNQLLMGAFLSPLDGPAASSEDVFPVLLRRDAKIYMERLYGETGTHALEGVDSPTAHEIMTDGYVSRWRALLGGSPRMQNVAWSIEDRYHTSTRQAEWNRSPHLVLSGGVDGPGLVFPLRKKALERLLGGLDGETRLADLLADILATDEEASRSPDQFSRQAFSLICLLDQQDWLEADELAPGGEPGLALPAPVLELLRAGGLLQRTVVTFDILATSCTFATEGLGEWELTDRSIWKNGFVKTRHTNVNHQRKPLEPALEGFLRELGSRLEEWEAGRSTSWWRDEAKGAIGCRNLQLPAA